MRITKFQRSEGQAVTTAWNQWLPQEFAIDLRLLEQLTFEHPSWASTQSKLIWDNNELVGFILTRDFQKQTIVDALVVAPHRRRQGLGKELLAGLRNRNLRVGGGPAHFVPGLPHDWRGAQAFFSSQGFQQDWTADDLHLELPGRPGCFTSTTATDQEAVVDMIRSEFSERWTNDTIHRFETGDSEDVLIIKKDDKPVAFCHSWHYQSQLLGPSVFWLRNSCSTFGGIGPVGVMAECRGQGLGKQIVEEALNYLSFKEVGEVVVDWTAIGPFYEKSGFRPWKKYLGFCRE